MAEPQIIPVAIMAGESLSDSFDITVGEATYVLMPGEWDGANLTFQVSFDNSTFWDLFDELGSEIMAACRPGVAVRIPPGMRAIGYCKIRSGTRDHPIEQSENRNFKIVFDSGPLPTSTKKKARPW